MERIGGMCESRDKGTTKPEVVATFISFVALLAFLSIYIGSSKPMACRNKLSPGGENEAKVF